MRTAGWMLPVLMLPAFAACAGQEIANQKPVLPEPTALPRSAHSSKADMAVAMCPVSFSDSIETDGIVLDRDKTVTPPKVVRSVDVELTNEALRQKQQNQTLNFEVVISVVVDANGKPQSVCLKKSAGYGLNAEVAKKVQQYKFKPATKDGKPVSNRISIGIDLHLD